MAISTIKTLKNALNRVSKGATESTMIEATGFAFDQLAEHRNTTPLMIILEALSSIAGKPKGLTRANMLDYIEQIGLEYDKKAKTISVPKKLKIDRASLANDFWAAYVTETQPKSATEKFETAAKSAVKGGLSVEEMLAILQAVAEEAASEAAE